ncbi:hypothetical protein [Streptomyces sp. NPDC086010]|uniref:hypothetical protein n=1 Tax=Streptomyces sp. NPDC086010 TaxID=3365745 RepID=UPI0037D4A515
MADNLHTRYIRAANTWHAHRAGCTTCQQGASCPTGAPLFERFVHLQDAYLNSRRAT